MDVKTFKNALGNTQNKPVRPQVELTETEKNLCHEVADGYYPAYGLIHIFYQYKRFDLILMWLVVNNMKGMKFVEWVRVEHENSPMSAGIYILRKIEKDVHRKRISITNDVKKQAICLIK